MKVFISKNRLILILILLGILYRLFLTSDGNFIFNMDNARDFVDVREMVVLHKPRLIALNSSIEGVFTGPAWYYMLAVPFILTGGDPYGGIVMEFVLWAIGGFFLLKLAGRYGKLAELVAGVSWIASNMVLLATAYSFNPNPIILLTPLFLYSLEQYLEKGKTIHSIIVWFLGGLFFNFQMNTGIFIPFIITLAILFSKRAFLMKEKSFWIGVIFFVACLLPQVFFDFRHDFLTVRSLLRYLANPPAGAPPRGLGERIPYVSDSFYGVILPGFMNNALFTKVMVLSFFAFIIYSFKNRTWHKDLLLLVSVVAILVPFVGYILLPVAVSSWHLGGIIATSILLSGILIGSLQKFKINGKVIAFVLAVMFFSHALLNISNYLKDSKKPNNDPSLFSNEVKAVDHVCAKANGKNFKVYTYLASIIDYPYQYLFWWRGLNKYGFVPKEYAYSPNVPVYIPNKDKLPMGASPEYDGLVFLIKQPDTRGERHLWENQFKGMELLSTEMVGPLIIETRRE